MFDFLDFCYHNYHNHKKQYRILSVSVGIGVFLMLFFGAISHGSRALLVEEIMRDPELYQIAIIPLNRDYVEEVNNRYGSVKGVTDQDYSKYYEAEQVLPLVTPLTADSIIVKYRAEDVVACSIERAPFASPDYPYYYDEFDSDGYAKLFPSSNLNCVDTSYSTFDVALCRSKGVDNPIIAGRDFLSTDHYSLLIDRISAWQMGFRSPEEMEDVLGVKVSFTSANGNMVTAEIVGVYDAVLNYDNVVRGEASGVEFDKQFSESYTPIRISGELMEANSNSFLGTKDIADALNGTETSYYEIRTSFSDLEVVLSSFYVLYDKMGENVSCYAERIAEALDRMKMLGRILILSGGGLLILTLINLISLIIVTYEFRKKWFAIQCVLGISLKKLSLGFFCEVGMAVLAGAFPGMILSILGCLSLNICTHLIYSQYRGGENVFFPEISTVVIVLCIFSLFFAVTGFIIKKRFQKLNILNTLKAV